MAVLRDYKNHDAYQEKKEGEDWATALLAAVGGALVVLVMLPATCMALGIFWPLKNRVRRIEWIAVGLAALAGLVVRAPDAAKAYASWVWALFTGRGSRLTVPVIPLALSGVLLAAILGMLLGSSVAARITRKVARKDPFTQDSVVPDAKKKGKISIARLPDSTLTVSADAHSLNNNVPVGSRLIPVGVDSRGVPATISEYELGMHALILGSTGSGKTVTIKSLAGALLDLGWSGTIMDLKEDIAPDGLRDWCRTYSTVHAKIFQEIALSDPAPRFWFNPLTGVGLDEAVDSITSLMEFDDNYWQALSRKTLGQIMKLMYTAHQIDPVKFPFPTTYDIGRILEAGPKLPAATKEMRAAVEMHQPGSAAMYDLLQNPGEAVAKNASTFGMRLTSLYDREAGRVLTSDASRAEIDITRDGLTYIGLDTQGKPELAKLLSSSMLQRMSVFASQRTTGQIPKGAQRFLIIDEANWINRAIVMNLLSRARGAGIVVILCTQGPKDWIDEQGDDWGRLTQNVNVSIIMSQGEPDSAELAAKYIGEEEQVEVKRQVIDRNVYDVGTTSTVDKFRVHPSQLRSLGIGEAILRVGKPSERVLWVKIVPRNPEIGPSR